jgi:VWFA-related protein
MAQFAALTAAFFTASLLLQQAQQPTFRARTDLVQWDVSVFDRDGRPVTGLPASAFTVIEDDAVRPIIGFSEIHIPAAPEVSAAWLRDAPTDVETNDVADRRLFVLVMDDASWPPITVPRGREIGRRFIDSLGPQDLAAVVFTGNNSGNAQGFTADRGRLRSVIDRATYTLLDPKLSPQITVRTLLRATDYLVGVPARRKALVIVTAFDMMMFVASSGPGRHLISLTERTFVAAQLANVNVFVLSVRYSAETALARHDEQDWVKRLPNETAGALVPLWGHDADVRAGVERIFTQTGSYYLLGYSSADPMKFHRVKVLVDRPDLIVRTRERYYWPDAVQSQEVDESLPAEAKALSGVLPQADLPLSVTVAPFGADEDPGATVHVVLGLRVAADAPATSTGRTFDIQASAFTVEGDHRLTTKHVLEIPETSGSTGRYDALLRMDLKPGRYELRLSANHRATGKGGAVYTTVDVPDFRSAPLALSGALVSATPAPASGPRDSVSALGLVSATTSRSFTPQQRVVILTRAYQGGRGRLKPAMATARIVDESDQIVFEQETPLFAESTATIRHADVRVDLPLSSLQPGKYLYSVEVVLDRRTARRDVRFEVSALR